MVKPGDGEHLLHTPIFLKKIDSLQQMAPPRFKKDSDLTYINESMYCGNMLMSVSRYIEGLIYSKVSGRSFQLIKNNPFRDTQNPYRGFEMLYTILAGDKLFGEVRRIRMSGVSLDKIVREDNKKVSMSEILDKMHLEAIGKRDKTNKKKE